MYMYVNIYKYIYIYQKEEHSQSKIESHQPTRKNKSVETAFRKSTRKPTESYTRIYHQNY